MSGAIFVFGSNLRGRHGAGSALAAARYHGAEEGIGFGPTGDAFAIPTRTRGIYASLPLPVIADYVAMFIAYANRHPELTFNCVAIGCGNAGYAPAEIAPLFRTAPVNVILPPEFRFPHREATP